MYMDVNVCVKINICVVFFLNYVYDFIFYELILFDKILRD